MIHLDLIKNLQSQKEKDDFEAYFRNNHRLLSRIVEVVSEWEAALGRQERSPKQYENASWDKLQAHRNGNLEITQRLKDLLSLN
jgi:hypothetical protein